MDRRQVLGILTLVVGISLVLAPVTMADWGEQAVIATERIDDSAFDEAVPGVHFENLTAYERQIIERAISSPDGSLTVYGSADWPDRFVYSSDYVAPGHGEYGLIYEGQQYELRTYAPDSWGIAFWLSLIPSITYGIVLLWVGLAIAEGIRSRRFAAAAIPGVSFHLIGPAFDFPLLSPRQFVTYGVVATIGLLAALLVRHIRRR